MELSLYPFIFLVFTVFFVWITMWISCGYAVDNFFGGSRTDNASGQNSEKRLTHSLEKSTIRSRVGRLKVGKKSVSSRALRGLSEKWHMAHGTL